MKDNILVHYYKITLHILERSFLYSIIYKMCHIPHFHVYIFDCKFTIVFLYLIYNSNIILKNEIRQKLQLDFKISINNLL